MSFGENDKILSDITQTKAPVSFGSNDKPFKAPEPKKNFFERFSDDIDDRSMIAGDIIDRYKDSEQGLVSTITQMVGKVGAGGVMDFIGESIVSGGRGLSNITPDIIEEPIKNLTVKAGVAFLNTDVGQAGLNAAKDGVESYQGWAKDHVVASANLEAIVDIALLAAPVKAKPGSAGILGKTGTALERSAVRSTIKTKRAFIEDLITPIRTKKVKLDQVSRTKEIGTLGDRMAHPFKGVKITPTKAEAESAAELLKIKLAPNRSVQKNYELMADAVNKETQSLIGRLRSTGAAGRYDKTAIFKELDDALIVLQMDPAIVGSAKASAVKTINMMKREIDASGNHVSDLLKARKSFDAKFRSQGRDAMLDPATQNAMTMAIRQVRQTTNDFINKTVPNVGVKNSLKKQSNILRAMDDVRVKAAVEPDLAMGRLGQRILKVLTLRGELNQSFALIFGVGGLGAAAMFAPWILKGGLTAGVFYGAGKAVMAPTTRRGLAQLLKLADKATLKITDPAVLRQMRADRALIVELLENAKIEDDPSGGNK